MIGDVPLSGFAYSPECVEEEFSEVRRSNLSPLRPENSHTVTPAT